MSHRRFSDDAWEISNLVAESHYLVDVGRWDELAEAVFVADSDDLVAEADFGFTVWRGRQGIRDGFNGSMPRFDAAAHATSNLHITIDGDAGVARYYVQGWHWVRGVERGADQNMDYIVVGIMTDEVVRRDNRWWVSRRKLERIGPGVALGTLPSFLDGLGQR